LIDGDEVFSGKSTGELVCLDAGTGETVWETNKVTELAGGASIHLTKNGDSVLLYTDRGELIRARLSRKAYEEISRMKLIEPTCQFGARRCAWAMPAYANGCVIVRNDVRLVCYPMRGAR
jgi:outer membrane protein assembly factor BamB